MTLRNLLDDGCPRDVVMNRFTTALKPVARPSSPALQAEESSANEEGQMHASSLNLRSSLRLLLVILIAAMAVTLPTRLVAQAYFGTVSGTLTDSSGALLQG